MLRSSLGCSVRIHDAGRTSRRRRRNGPQRARPRIPPGAACTGARPRCVGQPVHRLEVAAQVALVREATLKATVETERPLARSSHAAASRSRTLYRVRRGPNSAMERTNEVDSASPSSVGELAIVTGSSSGPKAVAAAPSGVPDAGAGANRRAAAEAAGHGAQGGRTLEAEYHRERHLSDERLDRSTSATSVTSAARSVTRVCQVRRSDQQRHGGTGGAERAPSRVATPAREARSSSLRPGFDSTRSGRRRPSG
jgi:hypothetical protein